MCFPSTARRRASDHAFCGHRRCSRKLSGAGGGHRRLRAQGIDDIVNLGDMASGPLDARRTMDRLMALDAVHVLGNHDRYLIDRPPEKMGSWDRPAHAQLDQPSRLAARGAADASSFATRCFSATQRRQTTRSIGWRRCRRTAPCRMASLEAIETGSRGITQSLILCGHTHIARAVRLARRPSDRQSRQRRLARLSRHPSISSTSWRPARRMRAMRSWNSQMAPGA